MLITIIALLGSLGFMLESLRESQRMLAEVRRQLYTIKVDEVGGEPITNGGLFQADW